MIDSASTCLAVHEDVQPHEVGGTVAEHLVIHRAVAVRDGLQLVVQVVDHLRERHLVDEDDAAAGSGIRCGRRCRGGRCTSASTSPMFSAGIRKLIFTIGSRNSSICPRVGHLLRVVDGDDRPVLLLRSRR